MPRLRFDKVARRLVERLQSGLRKDVPPGMTVLFTVTAPIRLASKSASELEEKIRHALQRGSPGRDRKYTIHGNHARVRLVGHGRARVPKVLGFVHNLESDAARILNSASEKLAAASWKTAGRGTPCPTPSRCRRRCRRRGP